MVSTLNLPNLIKITHLRKLRAHGEMSYPAEKHRKDPKKEIDQPATCEIDCEIGHVR